MTLRDLKDAFRQLLLALDDQEYIQYSLFGMTWRDTRQAYGVASAGANCQEFAELMVWLLQNKTTEFADEFARILAYIDDYTFGAHTLELTRRLTAVFDKVLEKLNVKISVEKNEDCIQIGVAHGIASISRTVRRQCRSPTSRRRILSMTYFCLSKTRM